MTAFDAVDRELDRWAQAGLSPRFWLRDDDAIEPTPALDRLIGLVEGFRVPLLLAVIPARATLALADRLATAPLVTPCVHGYAHRRYTPEAEKAVELGGDRPISQVLAELAEGRDLLQLLFGERLSRILVPPWNRIAPDVAARIGEVGFTALSTSSWTSARTPLPELNVHVDIMDWTARTGRDNDWTATEIVRRLRQARKRNGAPLGILSHHLVHDERAWATLEALMRHLTIAQGLRFHRADDLIALQ